VAHPFTRARCALLMPLVPLALLSAACQAPAPAPRQAELPGGRTLVRGGLGPDGDLVVATDDAPEECHAPEAWRRAGGAWREAARGPAALADQSRCPPVTARLADDGRTLAVHDYSAGRAQVLDVAATGINPEGTAAITAEAGFAFPPPCPNLAFSGDAGKLLLGSVNRGCRARPAGGGGRACGLAELFERREGDGWERVATFLPVPERDGLIRFGQSVALAPDGSLALVGGTGEPGRSGALWVYAVEPGGPRLVQILAPRGRREGWFANDVALSGDGNWLAVGGEQSVHLYERLGQGFAFRKLLTAPDAAAGHFGETVALSRDGRRLLVGAPRTACAEGERCGAVYLFERDRLWRLARTLRPATEAADTHFGHHLAISADGGEAAVQGRALHEFTLGGGE
jgi:hypothetical protein